MNRPDRIDILGVPVGAYTMQSLLNGMEEAIAIPGCRAAYYVNANTLNLACSDREYLQAMLRAEIVYVDGASVRLAALLLGGCLPEKLTTTDVWPKVCELALRKGYRFFLLGGETGLAERAAQKAVATTPGLQIVGSHHGYFDLKDERVIDRINALRPHILWVGMGGARQVMWTEAARGKLEVPLVITCGGLFKFVSGEVERAPSLAHRNGFEWIFRIIREPALWERYAVDLPKMAVRILAQLLHKSRVSY